MGNLLVILGGSSPARQTLGRKSFHFRLPPPNGFDAGQAIASIGEVTGRIACHGFVMRHRAVRRCQFQNPPNAGEVKGSLSVTQRQETIESVG